MHAGASVGKDVAPLSRLQSISRGKDGQLLTAAEELIKVKDLFSCSNVAQAFITFAQVLQQCEKDVMKELS